MPEARKKCFFPNQVCSLANENGAKIIHGNRNTFVAPLLKNGQGNPFIVMYKIVKDFDLKTGDIKADIIRKFLVGTQMI